MISWVIFQLNYIYFLEICMSFSREKIFSEFTVLYRLVCIILKFIISRNFQDDRYENFIFITTLMYSVIFKYILLNITYFKHIFIFNRQLAVTQKKKTNHPPHPPHKDPRSLHSSIWLLNLCFRFLLFYLL